MDASGLYNMDYMAEPEVVERSTHQAKPSRHLKSSKRNLQEQPITQDNVKDQRVVNKKEVAKKKEEPPSPSILRSFPLQWLYVKVRSSLQPYLDDTFDATQMIPNLWVGSIKAPSNAQNMRSHSIKLIVSAIVGASALYPYEFKYRHAALCDVPGEDIMKEFDRLLPEIHKTILRGKGVLIHCIAGASRSATIAGAYLMKYHGMTAVEAVAHMKKKRDVVNPNVGYIAQLKKYEQYLLTTNSQVDVMV